MFQDLSLQGLSLLGRELGQPGPDPFQAVDPATGVLLAPPLHVLSSAEV